MAMEAVLLLSRAWHFAAERHVNQRRKGATQEPYVNHLAEVADLVAQATDGGDANLVAAAVLHDSLEDTATSRQELETLFGKDVAELVAEVTDDRSLPRERRKALQIERAPHKSDRAKILKLADKTSNLRSMVESPPVDWDPARCEAYLSWAIMVAAGLRGVNPTIEAAFDEAAQRLGAEFPAPDHSTRKQRPKRRT
jgi:(p)ppGpp synthase/HD superfamily hydrolase